jgi:hypothetical protein
MGILPLQTTFVWGVLETNLPVLNHEVKDLLEKADD